MSSLKTIKFLTLEMLIVLLPVLISADKTQVYSIEVNISEKKLFLIKDKEKMKEFPIAVPSGNYFALPLIGEVSKIIYNPVWYPTEATRRDYFARKGVELPRIVRADDPRNALGKVNFIIKFQGFTGLIRIHGTNEPESIGKKITRGCIRLYNEDAVELAEIIRGIKTTVCFK